MKKVILFACVAALGFASCGNSNNATEEAQCPADSVISVLASQIEAGDAASLESTLESLKATYEQLVEAGDLEGAKAYASAIQQFISEKSEAISSLVSEETTVSSLVETIQNLPTSAETTAEEALSAVKSDAQDAVDNAIDNVKESVEDAVSPVTDKVNEVKADVEETKAAVEEKKEQAAAVKDAAKTLLGK